MRTSTDALPRRIPGEQCRVPDAPERRVTPNLAFGFPPPKRLSSNTVLFIPPPVQQPAVPLQAAALELPLGYGYTRRRADLRKT